jgi:MFS family permease
MNNRLRNIRTFQSLKYPAFRLYYIGMIGQWSSMNMQIVTRSLLIYRVSDSGAILGLASLANAIPMIIFSLYGGALADRIQKKDILLFSMIGSMLTSLAVALSLTLGYLSEAIPNSWWILIVTAILQGMIMGLMMPSRQAIIAEVVPDEQVMNAVSLNMMGMNVFRILAPAATGFLIDAFEFASVYYISTAMYGLAAVCMFLMPKTTQKFSEGTNALADIIDGVKYIRQKRTIMLVLVATVSVMICGIPFMQLMPMITEDILKVGASGMGILMSISGVGAITGSLTLASLPSRKRGAIMIASGIIMGLALIGFAFSKWWLLSVLVVIFIGLGQTGHRTTGNSLAQNYTEAEYRGRVMSFMMMGIGFSSLGTFFAGILSEVIGIQWSIGGLAMILVIASVALLTLTPRLRKLD